MVGEHKKLGGCVIFELVAFFGFLVKAVYPSAGSLLISGKVDSIHLCCNKTYTMTCMAWKWKSSAIYKKVNESSYVHGGYDCAA